MQYLYFFIQSNLVQIVLHLKVMVVGAIRYIHIHIHILKNNIKKKIKNIFRFIYLKVIISTISPVFILQFYVKKNNLFISSTCSSFGCHTEVFRRVTLPEINRNSLTVKTVFKIHEHTDLQPI